MSSSYLSQFYSASYLEKRFELKAGYFKRASKQKTKMNLDTEHYHSVLFIKLPAYITQLIKEGYISVKIKDSDCLDLFDDVYELTKQTKIGFYK